MEPCRSAGGSAATLERALVSLALVWLSLAIGAAGCPRLGVDAAVLLAFGLATAGIVATRPRGARSGSPRRVAAGALAGLAAGWASYPAWWSACLLLVLALGLSPGAPREPAIGPGACRLAAVLLAPLFEEPLYRGRLLDAIRPRLGAPATVALTSVLFALPHGEPAAVAATFLVGTGLAAARLAGRSLAVAVGLHAGLNLAALVCGAPPERASLAPGPAAAAGMALLAPATWWLRRAPPGVLARNGA
jgi:membrane protease YdiL (CAAX protease family)